MSALGQKQTLRAFRAMSVLPLNVLQSYFWSRREEHFSCVRHACGILIQKSSLSDSIIARFSTSGGWVTSFATHSPRSGHPNVLLTADPSITTDNHAYRKLWPSDSFVRSVSASRNCHQFFMGQIVRVGWA
jgi:hypothetical protein